MKNQDLSYIQKDDSIQKNIRKDTIFKLRSTENSNRKKKSIYNKNPKKNSNKLKNDYCIYLN